MKMMKEIQRIETGIFQEERCVRLENICGDLVMDITDVPTFEGFLWKIHLILKHLKNRKIEKIMKENEIKGTSNVNFKWKDKIVRISIFDILINSNFEKKYAKELFDVSNFKNIENNKKIFIVKSETISGFFWKASRKLTKNKLEKISNEDIIFIWDKYPEVKIIV